MIQDSQKDLKEVDRRLQSFSTVELKFTDTSPGGNFAINPAPQFTEYADLRPELGGKRVASRRANGKGMGRYYSEAIDDNAQIIQMRMGVAQHTPLSRFFMHFYNAQAARISRTGRADMSFFGGVGKAIGYGLQIVFWPLAGISILANTWNGLTGKPRTRYYYLKPTMPTYWAAVQNIVNQLSVNTGLIPRVGGAGTINKQLGDSYTYTEAELKAFESILPDIFNANEPGTIDVFKIANRAQRLARKQELEIMRMIDKEGASMSRELQLFLVGPIFEDKPKAFKTYMDEWLNSRMGMASNSNPTASLSNAIANTSTDAATAAPTMNPTSFSETVALTEQEAEDSSKWWQAELNDGSAWVGFKVNYTGAITDNFTSGVTESEISSKINSMSSSARSTRFSLADGAIGDGVVGKILGTVGMAATELLSGIGESLDLSGLAVLGGNAFTDIPKHWDSSEAQIGSTSYTVVLNSPYGNPLSRLLNIHLPLACLLAAALPLSTGGHSYTSPFLIEYYDKGRAQSRLGLMTSLSVSRGEGNTGWTKDGHALQLTCTFTIQELSSVIHIPISSGISIGEAAANAATAAAAGVIDAAGGDSVVANALTVVAGALTGAFSDDSLYTDYMAVLGSLGLADQIYPMRKLKLALTKQRTDFQTATSWSRLAAVMVNTTVGQIAGAPFAGTVR
ncbi:MAG: hypothetical protein NTZ16_16450 [Verrucomicrobia bacterium]|nr:hypothetical protein [Verrucomicrobiota bacterium]